MVCAAHMRQSGTTQLFCEEGLCFTSVVSLFLLRPPHGALVWLLGGSVSLYPYYSVLEPRRSTGMLRVQGEELSSWITSGQMSPFLCSGELATRTNHVPTRTNAPKIAYSANHLNLITPLPPRSTPSLCMTYVVCLRVNEQFSSTNDHIGKQL